jgi:hypothetical protein
MKDSDIELLSDMALDAGCDGISYCYSHGLVVFDFISLNRSKQQKVIRLLIKKS